MKNDSNGLTRFRPQIDVCTPTLWSPTKHYIRLDRCPGDIYLKLVSSSTRSNNVSIRQRLLESNASAALFSFQVPSISNKPSSELKTSATLSNFKRNLLQHLLKLQYINKY